MSESVLFVINTIAVLALGFYLILNLQWYSYKLERVLLKHHKTHWHLIYFLAPLVAYFALGEQFWIALIVYIILLSIWYRNIDKKLVFTWRVKRFFTILITSSVLINLLCVAVLQCSTLPLLSSLVVAYILSTLIEKYLFTIYYKEAQKRLNRMDNLTTVAITGSYGKTSMKNFLSSILSTKYRVYQTPRSVNTLGGIIKDINESLPENSEVYICEAGARRSGDILEIAHLLHHHYAVVGEVGEQHIEYFKSLENIRRTKLELVNSPRLKKAYVHHKVTNEPNEKVEFFADDIQIISSTLQGVLFKIGDLELQTKLLGSFNTNNIAAAVKVAKELGVKDEEIVKSVKLLKPVSHRLELINSGDKIILDDGYNGNIEGMREGIRLCSTHVGRKVIVTPGLVESSDELNAELSKMINSTFDLAIITGSLNVELFKKYLTLKEIIYLEDKSMLVKVLGEKTASGDIIYFANDAPNFI